MDGITIQPWKRAVIKVGSGLIAPGGKKISTKYMLAIAGFIAESRNQGKEVILVSSGAVAAGLSMQVKKKMHRSIPEKQALAAIGQPLLMAAWSRFFDFPCSQVLLTYDDINDRRRFVNAKNTIQKLLELGTLPIVNENDTIAVEELKVGDNDNLAAYVAILTEADLLIICTDIDGLYDCDPRRNNGARLIPVVEKIDSKIYSSAEGSKNPIATGGMKTKIEAAHKAVLRGIDTIILNSTKKDVLDLLLHSKLKGTIFKKNENHLTAIKHWLLHAHTGDRKIIVDEGAAKAICEKGASLLTPGVVAVKGDFKKGEPVEILLQNEKSLCSIAKGLPRYNSNELKKILGKKSSEISAILGYRTNQEVIHRDELVLILDVEGEIK